MGFISALPHSPLLYNWDQKHTPTQKQSKLPKWLSITTFCPFWVWPHPNNHNRLHFSLHPSHLLLWVYMYLVALVTWLWLQIHNTILCRIGNQNFHSFQLFHSLDYINIFIPRYSSWCTLSTKWVEWNMVGGSISWYWNSINLVFGDEWMISCTSANKCSEDKTSANKYYDVQYWLHCIHVVGKRGKRDGDWLFL